MSITSITKYYSSLRVAIR